MSDVNTFNCPKCGAVLTATGDQAEMQCQYCGNTVIVPEELRTAGAESLQAAETAREISGVGKFIALIVGGSFALPLVIVGATLCILLVTFVFVGQMISTALAPLSNFKPTALISFATNIPASTAAPRATATARFTATPSSTPLPTPLPAATPTPYSKAVLKDDFSDPASGWDRKNSSDYILDYVKGGYRIFIGKDNGGELVWIKDGLTNVSVEADAQKIGGPDEGWFGVLCRVKEGAGGYAFEVSMDGSYQIDKYTFTPKGDQTATLTSGSLNPNLLKAGEANHLRAACDRTTLSLFVNEQFVSQTSDADFSTGGVGLISLTGGSGKSGVDHLFSNFVVKGP